MTIRLSQMGNLCFPNLHHLRRHSHRHTMPRNRLGGHGPRTDGGVFADGGLVEDFHALYSGKNFDSPSNVESLFLRFFTSSSYLSLSKISLPIEN